MGLLDGVLRCTQPRLRRVDSMELHKRRLSCSSCDSFDADLIRADSIVLAKHRLSHDQAGGAWGIAAGSDAGSDAPLRSAAADSASRATPRVAAPVNSNASSAATCAHKELPGAC